MSKNKKKVNGHKVLEINRQKQNNEAAQDDRQLKDRFLEAVAKGELGSIENSGTVVTLKAFKAYFSDIKSSYINSFLPAATLEPGQVSASHTKFLFRLRKGAYRVHPEALEVYVQQQGLSSPADSESDG